MCQLLLVNVSYINTHASYTFFDVVCTQVQFLPTNYDNIVPINAVPILLSMSIHLQVWCELVFPTLTYKNIPYVTLYILFHLSESSFSLPLSYIYSICRLPFSIPLHFLSYISLTLFSPFCTCPFLILPHCSGSRMEWVYY